VTVTVCHFRSLALRLQERDYCHGHCPDRLAGLPYSNDDRRFIASHWLAGMDRMIQAM